MSGSGTLSARWTCVRPASIILSVYVFSVSDSQNDDVIVDDCKNDSIVAYAILAEPGKIALQRRMVARASCQVLFQLVE